MVIKFFDAFAGIGGFHLAVDRASKKKWECVGFSEIDSYAKSVYQKHFPDCKDYNNITKIDINDLPDFDVLIGGVPCQAWSVAGKRKGFKDDRGNLWFNFIDILKTKRPKMFLAENVKGLLSQKKSFTTLKNLFDEAGYFIDYKVLNAKNFDVPQNRERVFIVGIRKNLNNFFFSFDWINGWKLNKKLKDILEDNVDEKYYLNDHWLDLISTNEGDEYKKLVTESKVNPEVSYCITTTYRKIGGKADIKYYLKKSRSQLIFEEGQIHQMNNPKHSGYRIYGKDGMSSTLKTHGWRPFVFTDMTVRRLTPVECLRLMGFPDNWNAIGKDNEKISDTQRYKQIGNSVAVPVVEQIIKKMESFL